jgi:hypothetical protein
MIFQRHLKDIDGKWSSKLGTSHIIISRGKKIYELKKERFPQKIIFLLMLPKFVPPNLLEPSNYYM